jgi:hypothetical protein
VLGLRRATRRAATTAACPERRPADADSAGMRTVLGLSWSAGNERPVKHALAGRSCALSAPAPAQKRPSTAEPRIRASSATMLRASSIVTRLARPAHTLLLRAPQRPPCQKLTLLGRRPRLDEPENGVLNSLPVQASQLLVTRMVVLLAVGAAVSLDRYPPVPIDAAGALNGQHAARLPAPAG